MTRFFARLTPQNPVLRNNYFIQVDDKLAWSESIGDEDAPGVGWASAVRLRSGAAGNATG
jgi:alpha-1,2-mannosyltransferase